MKGKKFEAQIAISKNQKLGFVTDPDTAEDVIIFLDDTMQAFSGDTVAVELVGQKSNGMQRAVVTELVARKRKKFVGTVDKTKRCYVKPDSNRVHVDFILHDADCANVEHDDRVYIEMTSWNEGAKNPDAKIIEVLGKKNIHDVEMRAIVLEKGFDADFPKKVLEEANQIKNKQGKLTAEETAQRRDIRGTLTFTIDPADAKDFDDALSFKKLDNGNYEIGVHIADVAHYVQPGTAIDEEAIDRAFSVYLVDRTIPMLPEVLSNDLCSLNPHEDKCAFSAIFEITPEAEVISEWFGRTIMNSDHRFTYEAAQRVLDGDDDTHTEAMHTLNDIAKKLDTQKILDGAIRFTSEEFEFQLDSNNVPVAIHKKKHLATHSLIENFMLLANRHVARYMHDKCQKLQGSECQLMYRVHNLPDKDKIAELAVFVKALGYTLPIAQDGSVSPKSLNTLINQAEGKPEEGLISSAAVKTMSKAVYSTTNNGHFGLAFGFYTHFTSPIRRYPDLIVHRIMAKLLADKKPDEKDAAFFNKMALHASNQEVAAQDAERTSIRYKQVEFMQNHVGETFEGIISGVAPFGAFVALTESGAEGMVHISKLGEDYWQHDEKRYRIVGEKTGKQYTLGDKVKVKIDGADLDNKKLDMSFV